MASKSQKMLEEGSFGQLILKLSLPAVLVIIIMIIYNMADTYFIGQTGDPNKISAISLSMPVFTVLSGIGTLFGNGGATTISIALGQRDESKIQRITAYCLAGCLVIGIGFWAVVFFLAQPLAVLLGADASTMDFTITYLRTFSLASPMVLFSTSFGSIIRADGDATTAMIPNMAGTFANMILDALFILVFHWDVFGAAFETVLGNALSCVILVWILVRKKQNFLPHISRLSLEKEIVVPVTTLGLPMTFSTMLGSISSTIQNRMMMSHGSVYLAAQSVSGKVGMLITMLIMGFCMGMQPAISYNFGSRNYRRMYQVIRDTGIFTMCLGVVLTVICAVFKNAIVAAFIDNDEVIACGQVFVIAAVIVGPVYGVYQLCQTFMQATGKVSFAIFTSLLDKGIIYLPVLYLMDRFYGAYGIAFAHAVTMVFSIALALLLSFVWSRQIKEDQEVPVGLR
jgi:putative MATE family efflux protein